MGMFSWLKAEKKPVEKIGSSTYPSSIEPPHDDMFKAYIPNFLYRPPFGFPLNKNTFQLKALAKNPYVFSVIRTLKDEASTTSFDIKPKEEFMKDAFSGSFDEDIKRIKTWFDNPNGNEESFSDILGQWIQDLCEVDAAVGVKVFTRGKKFSQLFARDGASFLKNPNIYGYIGDREEFIDPIAEMNPNMVMPDKIKIFGAQYSEAAAYYQYGYTGNALPVPFGRREIMYIMANPRSDSVYGRSPLEILEDILLTLIYGAQYNTDFYLNGNAPDGLINLVGADTEIAEAFQARMRDKVKTTDKLLGYSRRVGHRYPVWGGPEAKFIPFQLTSKDMDIIEQQKWFTKLVWSAFGVTPDQMGYTEDSNKAVSQTQTGVYKKKALKPMLRKIEYMINSQLMHELDPSGKFEFKFEDFDIEEDIKKMTLFGMRIDKGVMTAEMVAEELGIDTSKLKQQKGEKAKQDMEMAQQTNPGFLPEPKPTPGTKSESDIISNYFKDVKKELLKELDKNGPVSEI